jgi:hypothetical protein
MSTAIGASRYWGLIGLVTTITQMLISVAVAVGPVTVGGWRLHVTNMLVTSNVVVLVDILRHC